MPYTNPTAVEAQKTRSKLLQNNAASQQSCTFSLSELQPDPVIGRCKRCKQAHLFFKLHQLSGG